MHAFQLGGFVVSFGRVHGGGSPPCTLPFLYDGSVDPFVDYHGRPLRSLRLSVPDCCNFRCTYCVPEKEYKWLPKAEILSLIIELEDVALTTNAFLLATQAADLHAAGLQRLNISLDTLKRERFHKLTQRDALAEVLEGIRIAGEVGFRGTKIDTVMMRGQNDDEIIDLLEFSAANDLKLRFIEYMDVGGATQWSESQVLERDVILERVETHYGAIEALKPYNLAAPARIYRLNNGIEFGIIASTTTPFCGECDRSRIAADGTWFSCLYANHGVDLRELLRNGDDDQQLAVAIADLWRARNDRGAEDRKAQVQRGPAVDLEDLLADTRLEMHTRGG